jgi:hypothetical protein
MLGLIVAVVITVLLFMIFVIPLLIPTHNTPKVVLDTGIISKPESIPQGRFGQASDIAYDKHHNVVIAGKAGAVLLESDLYTFLSTTTWPGWVDNIAIVTNKSGDIQYLDRGGWSTNAKLMDPQGKTLWEYKNIWGINDTGFGDVDGDGVSEFAVGMNGSGGISLLNHAGSELWNRIDGNVWHVEMADINNDGKQEIIHSNGSGRVIMRNNVGTVLKNNKPSIYVSKFSLCPWPSRTSHRYILTTTTDAIYILDYDGNTQVAFDAPGCEMHEYMHGVWIKLSPGHADYLAVLVDSMHQGNSILFIYAPPNKLVYQEILPGTYNAIATITDPNTHREVLVLGGDGKLLRYTSPDNHLQP